MKRLLILAVALLTVLGARSQNRECTLDNCAVVTGEYQKEYDPDEIYVQILICERDSKGKVSIEEQQHAMTKALSASGINTSRALKIKNLSSTFYRKGLVLTYGSYELKLTSPEEFYMAYHILRDLELWNVSIGRIDRSDRDKLTLEGAVEAMKNARRKAEMIAAAEKRRVGTCLYFADDLSAGAMNSNRLLHFTEYNEDRMVQNGPQPMPMIGTITIHASIEARFQLE